MSLSSDPQAAANVQQCLKDLYKLVQNVDEVKKNDETVLSAISLTHRKIESDEKLTAGNRSKLQSLYENGISDAEKEEDLLRQALSKIYQIRQIRSEIRIQARNSGNKETIRRGALMKMLAISAETIPLWVGREGEEAPPLCGAIPPESNYTANPGDMAAALVRSPDGDENWILAEVVSFNSSTGKYEVDDIDEEQKDRHSLSRRKVIPLPTQRASPETNPEALYPPGTTVMAIYPQTTCFYKGVIKEQPSGGAEDYHVLFEDPSYADGYSPPLNVAQRYIIQVPEKKKGK
ncbi:SAGA-associated factor 29 [Lepeophtheirus salmonis]|uniref:SAGA-associated factor 29 n=1 Tax=Lepeophtheirus salmonis TaxID=72036 RepID=UPI001AE27ECC|nr:SAGA-associated factor 29-like [Lepeophtheirus salmonis]